jgi:1-acyl-sn-glycerol-3-phosphate acyltransferase
VTRPRKAAAAAAGDGPTVRRRRPAATTRRPSEADSTGGANGHRGRAAATVSTVAAAPEVEADNGATPGGNGATPDEDGVAAARSRPRARTDGAPRANGRRPAPAGEPGGPDDAAGADDWPERVADLLAFLRRRLTGRYEVDEFGFDPELTETVFYPLLRLLYRHYFRVEVIGAHHLPTHGPALLVANHSGTVPVDALMLSVAVHDETPTHRHMRLLGADLVFRIPVLSEFARKSGSTLACNPDAERLLRAGEVVGVFPEGFKGIGKHYRDRYKLQRFGRGGFVSAALRTGTPIVPISIVGAEEIYPIIGSITPLAKVLGLPYFPVTPLFPWFGPLGLLPLPSKWLIEFSAPIPTVGRAEDADDPVVVFNVADQVRETIQQTLYALLERRPDPFS